MTDQHFALFDTRIGLCAVAWGPRGINGTQLPMGGEQKIRTASVSATLMPAKPSRPPRCSRR